MRERAVRWALDPRDGGDTDWAGWKDLPAGNALTVTQPSGQFHAVGWFDTNTVVGVADASDVVLNEAPQV